MERNPKVASPFFSIVIPIFNRSTSVQHVLVSLIDQEFTNWEALVIDDGSDDSEVLESLISSLKDGRFRYVRRANGGGGAARNTGILLAEGEFVAFLDSDDSFLDKKLRMHYEYIIKQKLKQTFFWSSFFVDRGEGHNWIKPSRGPYVGECIGEYLTCTTGWIQTSTMVVESALAKSVLFSEEIPSSQDTDFAIRCNLAGAKFHFFVEPLCVINDRYDSMRVSKQRDYKPLLKLSDDWLRLGLSNKSYRGYRGWQCARIISHKNIGYALKLFLQACINGAFDFRVSLRVLLQIILSERLYQLLVDRLTAVLAKLR